MMAAVLSSIAVAPSPVAALQPSLWHSPVPYLFGGLAVMMALIASALLILGCSYWKHSSYFENDGVADIEPGNGNLPPESYNHREYLSDMEDKYLVIMAGEAKPTFLATPSSSRTTSFGSSSCRSSLPALTEMSSRSEGEIPEEMMMMIK